LIHTPRHANPPQLLVRHKDRWTRRFQEIHAGGLSRDWATKTARQALRAVLYGFAHGKCVYCEGALGVTAQLDIEHYTAKSVAPERAFEWENLLPACSLCNGSKGEVDHGNILLKPDAENPETYFWMHPDTGELEPHPLLEGDQIRRALETIRICGLQRAALCTKRLWMFRRVSRWMDEIADRGELSDPLIEEWKELSDPRSGYKFVFRHVLTLRGLQILAQRDRDAFERTPNRG